MFFFDFDDLTLSRYEESLRKLIMELNVTIMCKDSLTYGRHRLLHSKTGYSYTTRGLHYNLQHRALASITTTAKQDKEIFRKK